MNQNSVSWIEARDELVNRDQLLMQLDVYEENLMLKTFQGQNGIVTVRRVSPDEVASAFLAHMTASTGLLPEGAIWWQNSLEGVVTAVWREPAVWPIALKVDAFQPAERLRLPMPGLIFLQSVNRIWVMAARSRPRNRLEQLYHAPCFNVFRNGQVCPGNHIFPEQRDEVPESFFASHFSQTADTRERSRRYPNDLIRLWRELDGQESYPVDDLVEMCTVEEAMEIPNSRTSWF